MTKSLAASPYERFAVVRVSAHDKPPDNAINHGAWPEIMEHVPDSRVIKQKLKIINDAAHAQTKLNDIRARERAVTAREDAVAADHAGFNHDLTQELTRRITELEVRLAQLEDKRNHDPDDDELPTPPGYPSPPFLHASNDPMKPVSDDAHIPGGELHEIPAKDPEEEQQLDTRGEFLRLKKPVSLDQTEFPEGELQPPPVVKQPIAAGLDDGD